MTIEEHAPSGLGEVESLMLKKIAITALVAMLSCAALAEAHPRYGWKDRPSEKSIDEPEHIELLWRVLLPGSTSSLSLNSGWVEKLRGASRW